MSLKLRQFQKILLGSLASLSLVLSSFASANAEPLVNDGYQPIPSLSFTNLALYQDNHLKANKIFYEKHAGTNYDPIHLEASLEEALIIDLEDILATAIEHNLNLNIARADSDMSKWKFWQKFSDALPDVQMRASSQKRDGTFYLNSRFQNTIDETIVATGVRFNYRLFNGGTTTFLAVAEKYYKQATKEHERAVYQQILLDSVTYYYDLLRNQTALFAKLKALEQANANFELAQKFFSAGTGTKYDVMQAEAGLARAQQQLIEQEAGFRNAQINLAAHLNQPLETPYLIDKNSIDAIRIVDEDMPVQDILKSAFQRNPNIISALKAKQGALREGLSKVGDFLPKVDIYADIAGSGENFGDLFGITTLGFDANYSIGDGMGLTAVSNAMQSRAKVNKAKLEYARELQGIEKGLRGSYINFQKSKSLVNATQKEVAAAGEAVRISQLRYKSGLEIFSNLLEKERDLTAAELNLITSTANYNIAQAQLAYNMGVIDIKNILGNIE